MVGWEQGRKGGKNEGWMEEGTSEERKEELQEQTVATGPSDLKMPKVRKLHSSLFLFLP